MSSTLVTVNEYEARAYEILPQNARDYYKSGAGDEHTLSLNKEAFRRLRIRPRFLVPVSNRDMSVEIFGDRVKIPFGISPTAMQKMAHADGECANARGLGSDEKLDSPDDTCPSDHQYIYHGGKEGTVTWTVDFSYIPFQDMGINASQFAVCDVSAETLHILDLPICQQIKSIMLLTTNDS
ncbi:peroxisomal (S)-2-hydroxy-acid oxidase-like [Ctenocephalides felis]|uniref:peroxisomal (S)-2-hydroxy-acid oxidase-like n=1 Tax=Ctenocephalides felis TaxID=7515 RepID=UPI000E6E4CE1|nr:peroxisomal (S)-2-hydroxy-acid oxidase-like [Ctenocephalides felis]